MSHRFERDPAQLLDSPYVDFDRVFGTSRKLARHDRDARSPARGGNRPRTQKAAGDTGRISYGTVHYDGLAYLVLPDGDSGLDLPRLCRAAAERSGLTRYGAPGLPTSYVALDPSSALAEVCFHVLDDCRRGTEPIRCAVYQLRVRGRFADLHGRERRHPELIADDYRVTQRLAHRVRATKSLHGLLYPSARSNGFCLAAFSDHVFCSSRFVDFVSLRVQSDRAVRLCATGSVHWRLLNRDELRRTA